jgi:protein disulfide isomerase
MKLIVLVLSIIVVFASGEPQAQQDPREDYIVKLTDNNFDEELKQHDVLLIEFYAPWDSDSIKIAEEIRRAADMLSKSKSGIKIAQVNCHTETGLKERFNITEFPVFKLYKNEELSDVKVDAQFAEEIIEFYRKSLGPIVREANDHLEVETLLEKNDKLLIYYGEESIKLFNSLADDRRLIFVHCGGSCNIEKAEKIVLMKYGEDAKTLESPFTKDNISELIEMNIYPYFSFSGGFIVDYVFNQNKKVLFYLTKIKNDEFIETIKEVAKDYKDKMFFIVANEETDQLTNDLIDYYVIARDALPEIRLTNVVSDDQVLHYKFEDTRNAENLRKFIDNFFAGKVESYVRSEPVPESQGIVYKVVGKTFDEVVLKSNKNVFLRIYAPDESASKNLESDFIKVAKLFKDVDGLIIAEINILANEIDLEVDNVPSLKLFLSNDKSKYIEYTEMKTFEDMKNFLNEKLGLNIQEEKTDVKPEL